MKTDRIDNALSYQKLDWVVEQSDDGLYLVVASAAMQHKVARGYRINAVAVFDYSTEERPFRVGSFSRLLERAPGKRAYFFLNFQLAIPEAEDVERFNFCRDILAREHLNLVFFVNQETHDRLNRGAMDLYSFLRLIMPFSDELAEKPELASFDTQPDRSTGITLPAPDFTLPRRQLLTQAIAYRNEGDRLYGIGRYRIAQAYYQAALDIRLPLLGEEHEDVASAYNNLGLTRERLGNYPKALEFHEKALKIREAVLGTNHPSTATTYNNLASVYAHMGDYPKALVFYEKALKTYEAVLGTEHPSTAATYNNLASVYEHMGDYPKALEFYEKALQIREAVLGAEHQDTAATYHNLGRLYLNWDKPEEAIPWLQRALKVRESLLGAGHPSTKRTRAALKTAEQRCEEETGE